MSVPQKLRTSAYLLLILFALTTISCDNADYRTLTDVPAPNRPVSAVFVQRRSHDALSSDVYYVAIIDKTVNPSTVGRVAHDGPVLVATDAQGLQLQWRT
jgi:hypothetical protein